MIMSLKLQIMISYLKYSLILIKSIELIQSFYKNLLGF
jgi:hypothetical protein